MADLFAVRGKIALVTGGTSGLGLMIARGLVEAGVSVYVSSRKADRCELVSKELSEIGSCWAIPADLSVATEVSRLAAEIEEREPRLDILVNNAGATWGAPFAAFPESAWDRVLNLNLRAVFQLTRDLYPLLKAAGTAESPARVINIGSVAGDRVLDMDAFSYGASKAAVHHLTRMLANELAPDHITVNAVAPGTFESRMMAATLEQRGEEIVGTTPLRRIGTPEDIVGAIIYLTSRAGAFVTGTVLPVDGGMTHAT